MNLGPPFCALTSPLSPVNPNPNPTVFPGIVGVNSLNGVDGGGFFCWWCVFRNAVLGLRLASCKSAKMMLDPVTGPAVRAHWDARVVLPFFHVRCASRRNAQASSSLRRPTSVFAPSTYPAPGGCPNGAAAPIAVTDTTPSFPGGRTTPPPSLPAAARRRRRVEAAAIRRVAPHCAGARDPRNLIERSLGPIRTTLCTIFVGEQSPLVGEDTVWTFFVPFGEIHYVTVPVGFVQFARTAGRMRSDREDSGVGGVGFGGVGGYVSVYRDIAAALTQVGGSTAPADSTVLPAPVVPANANNLDTNPNPDGMQRFASFSTPPPSANPYVYAPPSNPYSAPAGVNGSCGGADGVAAGGNSSTEAYRRRTTSIAARTASSFVSLPPLPIGEALPAIILGSERAELDSTDRGKAWEGVPRTSGFSSGARLLRRAGKARVVEPALGALDSVGGRAAPRRGLFVGCCVSDTSARGVEVALSRHGISSILVVSCSLGIANVDDSLAAGMSDVWSRRVQIGGVASRSW
ncbi:hypothetical protein C8R45DRAFT_1107392 [Mycena sanguinolenta]|nr:hypothetical protein C8R45DRAFT_1107392 [Mycena sanguinolenta]